MMNRLGSCNSLTNNIYSHSAKNSCLNCLLNRKIMNNRINKRERMSVNNHRIKEMIIRRGWRTYQVREMIMMMIKTEIHLVSRSHQVTQTNKVKMRKISTGFLTCHVMEIRTRTVMIKTQTNQVRMSMIRRGSLTYHVSERMMSIKTNNISKKMMINMEEKNRSMKIKMISSNIMKEKNMNRRVNFTNKMIPNLNTSSISRKKITNFKTESLLYFIFIRL